jgi:hypothetical protein
VGPRSPAPRLRAHRGTLVLRRHHNHHHHRSRCHHHLGVISPRGTTSSNNNSSSSNSSGRLASRVAEKSRAPSECNPFFPLVYLSCQRVLTHHLLVRASSSSAAKVAPPLPDTMYGGSSSQQQASAGSGAGDPPPAATTVLTATAASTTAMPSSTPSAAAEEVPTSPTLAIEGDAGVRPAPSCLPLWRRWRWFLGGGSSPAPSQKQSQFPSPGCYLVPIRLFMKLKRQSCGSGRRLRPSTSASATGAPSWRSAPRRHLTSSPLSGPNSRGTAKITKGTSKRCSPGSCRHRVRRRGWPRERKP